MWELSGNADNWAEVLESQAEISMAGDSLSRGNFAMDLAGLLQSAAHAFFFDPGRNPYSSCNGDGLPKRRPGDDQRHKRQKQIGNSGDDSAAQQQTADGDHDQREAFRLGLLSFNARLRGLVHVPPPGFDLPRMMEFYVG